MWTKSKTYNEIVDHINEVLFVLLYRNMLSRVQLLFIRIIRSQEYRDGSNVGGHFLRNHARKNNLVPSCIVSGETSVYHITFSLKHKSKTLLTTNIVHILKIKQPTIDAHPAAVEIHELQT